MTFRRGRGTSAVFLFGSLAGTSLAGLEQRGRRKGGGCFVRVIRSHGSFFFFFFLLEVLGKCSAKLEYVDLVSILRWILKFLCFKEKLVVSDKSIKFA